MGYRRMTDRSGNKPCRPEVRGARAKSFDGYVVLEGEKVVAVALSREEADAFIARILGQPHPPTKP
jgi:hypothetical protein